MALAFRTASFVSAGNAAPANTTQAINKPAGTASGDIIVFVVYWETDTTTITPPSGFTSAIRIANTGAFMLETFYKLAGGSEPSSYTFTASASGQWRSIVGVAYSGGTGTGSLIDVTSSAQADSVGETSQTAPSVTTTGADRMLVFGYGNLSGTDIADVLGAATNFRGGLGGCSLGDALFASSGATGTSQADGAGTQSYAASHTAIISDTGGAAGAIPPLLLGRARRVQHLLIR